jgi:hypothetical protein
VVRKIKVTIATTSVADATKASTRIAGLVLPSEKAKTAFNTTAATMEATATPPKVLAMMAFCILKNF